MGHRTTEVAPDWAQSAHIPASRSMRSRPPEDQWHPAEPCSWPRWSGSFGGPALLSWRRQPGTWCTLHYAWQLSLKNHTGQNAENWEGESADVEEMIQTYSNTFQMRLQTQRNGLQKTALHCFCRAEMQVSIILGGRDMHCIASAPHIAAIPAAVHENNLHIIQLLLAQRGVAPGGFQDAAARKGLEV